MKLEYLSKELYDRIFRLCMGEMGDFSGAKYQFPGSWLPYCSKMVIRDVASCFKLISKSSGRLDYNETYYLLKADDVCVPVMEKVFPD